ncbi:BRO-N domain-containing protein [Desulfonatronum parangueonense]
MINNEPWFIAKEVTDKLEYPKAYDAIKNLCPDRRKITYKYFKKLLTENGSNPSLKISNFKTGCLIISRADAFALIDKSTKPEAKVMKEWLNRHVLPALHDPGLGPLNTYPAQLRGPPAATVQGADRGRTFTRIVRNCSITPGSDWFSQGY